MTTRAKARKRLAEIETAFAAWSDAPAREAGPRDWRRLAGRIAALASDTGHDSALPEAGPDFAQLGDARNKGLAMDPRFAFDPAANGAFVAAWRARLDGLAAHIETVKGRGDLDVAAEIRRQRGLAARSAE